MSSLLRTVRFCVLTVLRSFGVLPRYEAHIHGISDCRMRGEVSHRWFWTRSGAENWADAEVASANVVAFVARLERLCRDDRGELVSSSKGITTICKAGYEVDFREDDIYVVPQGWSKVTA